MSEAKLQKLKVTELKDILAKHGLHVTGKKDELVKRLLDAGISGDDEEEEKLTAPDAGDELVELSDETEEDAGETEDSSTQPAATVIATSVDPIAPVPELTEEQRARKARAERFGVPFNPEPIRTVKPAAVPAVPASAPAPESVSKPAAEAKKEKPGAIDAAPLGISEEVLARRAAKFGLPDKKAIAADSLVAAPDAKAPTPALATPIKTTEITPEMAEKLAVEEEKKRKRAEKFGPIKPVLTDASNGDAPDAKKVKV